MPKYSYPGYGPTGQNWLTARPGTKGGYHGGNDNPAAAGTPVYAEHAGTVFRSGNINGYGLAVVVESIAPNGTKFYELYGHLAPGSLPAPRTPVTAGEPIPGAFIGTKKDVTDRRGLSTGPHLHREIISGNAPLKKDPALRLGILSSDITFKADPDTFDINNPTFPYEHEETKPHPERVPPSTHSPTGPSLPQTAPGGNPPARAPRSPNILQSQPRVPGSELQLSPGMPIPDAEGPTSIGGPNGPTSLVPPAPTLPPLSPANPQSSPASRDQQKRSAVPDSSAMAFAQGTPSATSAFPQAAAYSPTGGLFANLPRAPMDAAATSPMAFGAPGSGPQTPGNFHALARGVTELLRGPSQFAGNSLMPSAGAARLPGPLFPSSDPLAPDQSASFDGRFGNWTSSPGTAPRQPAPADDDSIPATAVRMLSSPILPSDPALRAAMIDQAAAASSPQAGRPIGIFSGRPMDLLPPSIFDPPGNSRSGAKDGDDWFNRRIVPLIRQ